VIEYKEHVADVVVFVVVVVVVVTVIDIFGVIIKIELLSGQANCDLISPFAKASRVGNKYTNHVT